jgi:glycosyltransferase involved in cell wall biosynthesis
LNILFITIAWPGPGMRNLYSDLMEEFVQRGHQVYAVGNNNTDNSKSTFLAVENGIHVLRVNMGKIRKASYFQKTLSLLLLGTRLQRAIKQHLKGVDIDLIIAPTPPITLSILYKKLKRKYAAPFYLLLKDMWPQGSVDFHVFRKKSLPWFFFRSHEVRVYKTANYIGCMSPYSVDYILANNHYLETGKVEVCPNSIRPTTEPVSKEARKIRSKYNIPEDACVFIFSGNLGVGHGLHFLVDTIRALGNYPKAFFVIGGSGTQLQYLQKRFSETDVNNLFLYEWLPREDFEDILQTSDVGLILLYKYTSPQFPSRLLSYLDYSKPVLCAVNEYTDVGTIVEGSKSGMSVVHGDIKSFIETIKYLAENPRERAEMGAKARNLLLEKFTVASSYEIIMKHFT